MQFAKARRVLQCAGVWRGDENTAERLQEQPGASKAREMYD